MSKDNQKRIVSKCCGKCLEYGIDGGNLCERWRICDESCTCDTSPLEVKEGSKDIEWESKITQLILGINLATITDDGGESFLIEPMNYWEEKIKSLLSQQEAKIKREWLEEIENTPIEKAHTYASENADIYRAYDRGQQRFKDTITSKLKEIIRNVER